MCTCLRLHGRWIDLFPGPIAFCLTGAATQFLWLPDGDGYGSALVNFRYIANGLVENVQRTRFRKFAQVFVVRNFAVGRVWRQKISEIAIFFSAYDQKRFSGVATRVSAKEAGVPRSWKQYRLSMFLFKN